MARKFNPAAHPRDRFGRFTKSRTVKASAKDRTAARQVAEGFQPKQVPTAERGNYLQAIGGKPGSVRAVADANRALRAGRTSDRADELDQAMVSLPDDLLLSRQVPAAAFGATDPVSLHGMKVRDAGFAPAQVGTPAAADGQVRMHIAVPAGTRAVVDPDTGEVVLDRDTEMVVAKVAGNGAGGHDMWLTVLPKADAPAGAAPRDGADTVRADLMKLRVPDLQARMRERGLRPGRMRKSQLVDALVADETGDDRKSAGEPAEQVVDAVRDTLTAQDLPATDWVQLADVRERLTGMTAAEQDALLRRLDRERLIHLDPDPSRNDRSPRERDAGITVGGQQMTLVRLADTDTAPDTAPNKASTSEPDAPGRPEAPAAVSLPPVDVDAYRQRREDAATGNAALQAAPQGAAGTNTLSPAQADALARYQDTFDEHYKAINGALRAGNLDGDTADTVADIDDAMNRSPLTRDVVTYRGIGDSRTMFGDRIDGDLTGMVWQELAYVSTSASETEARRFSSVTDTAPLRMRILTPAGVGAIDLSPAGSSEQELLLQRGLRFRVVVDRGMVGGVRHLDVEALPEVPA